MISESELEKFRKILIYSEKTLDILHPREDYREDIDHPIKEDKVISHDNNLDFSQTEFVKMIDEKIDIKSAYKDIVSTANLSTVKNLQIFIGISWLNMHKNGAFIPYECELLDNLHLDDCLFRQVFEPMERRFTRNYFLRESKLREIQLKDKINKWLDSLEFDYHLMMIRADIARRCYGDSCEWTSGSFEDFVRTRPRFCRGSVCDTDHGERRNTPWKPIAVHMLMTIDYNDDSDDSDSDDWYS